MTNTVKGKIFCIGLSKTGTTSLNEALAILGFTSKHYPSVRYIPHTLLWIKNKELYPYDALTDITVIPFYKKLDRQFPGSKFILTWREKESWLQSCSKYPRYQQPWYRLPFKVIKLRQQIYRSVRFDRQKFADAYDRHHQDVHEYFSNRPQDLLNFNLIGGEGWDKLCAFLGVPVPEEDFPLKNARKNNYDDTQIKFQKRL